MRRCFAFRTEAIQEVTMLSLSRAATLVSTFLLAAVMLTAAPSLSYAESGSVSMRLSKVGFIVGVGGGSGTLNFKGRQYRLSSAASAPGPSEWQPCNWSVQP